MELLIETGIAIPANVRGNKQSAFISTFVSTIKPNLNRLSAVGSSFLYPTANIAKDKRDFTWITNKYGKQCGKSFVIAAAPTGLRFFLAATGLQPEIVKLTEKYETRTGLKAAIAVDAPITENVPAAPATDAPAENDAPPAENAEVIAPIINTEA